MLFWVLRSYALHSTLAEGHHLLRQQVQQQRLSAASGLCLLVDNCTWDVTSGFPRKAVSSMPVCSDVLAAGSTAVGKS